MNKKIIFSLIVILVFAGGGFFWWWQDQKDVRELNKDLPEGVRVVKNFAGEYRVVNKIDGYEIKVPEEWRGLKEVKYHEEEEGIPGVTGLTLEGIEGRERAFGIISHKLDQPDISLEFWVEIQFQKFGLSETTQFRKFKVGDFDIIQVKTEEYFADFAWYFFKKNQRVYEIQSVSEEFIREIITNGQW